MLKHTHTHNPNFPWQSIMLFSSLLRLMPFWGHQRSYYYVRDIIITSSPEKTCTSLRRGYCSIQWNQAKTVKFQASEGQFGGLGECQKSPKSHLLATAIRTLHCALPCKVERALWLLSYIHETSLQVSALSHSWEKSTLAASQGGGCNNQQFVMCPLGAQPHNLLSTCVLIISPVAWRGACVLA